MRCVCTVLRDRNSFFSMCAESRPCAMSRAISVSRGECYYACATERHFALKGVLCLNGTICTSAFASASVNTTA